MMMFRRIVVKKADVNRLVQIILKNTYTVEDFGCYNVQAFAGAPKSVYAETMGKNWPLRGNICFGEVSPLKLWPKA